MLVHKNTYFSVIQIDDYYSIEFPLKQVIILTVVDKKYFLFVKVKRPLLKDSTIEFPSGSVNSNESINDGALRELFEETGIEVKSTKRLIKRNSLSTMPSRFAEKLSVFEINLSMEEYKNRKNHDDEIEEVFLKTFSEAKELIESGKIYVMGTISLVFSYLNIFYERK